MAGLQQAKQKVLGEASVIIRLRSGGLNEVEAVGYFSAEEFHGLTLF